MSGIFGLMSPRDSAFLREGLTALAEGCRQYGHDGSGEYFAATAALGCHLEHLSPEVPKSDPIVRLNGCVAVMDALLFNRDELHPRPAPSDEMLLMQRATTGGKGLASVNGDFAGAVYDPAANTLLLFRDHTGVRPLYIYHKDDVLAFATELRALLALPGADGAVNERQLYLRLMGGNTTTADETDFAFIRMLPAGHTAEIRMENGRFRINESAFYHPGKRIRRFAGRRALQRDLYALVKDAVERRLQAVPGLVGAEMSGGLDSGVIDVFIRRAGREALYLSWSPDPALHPIQEGDERLLIDALCRQEGVSCHYLPPEDALPSDLLTQSLPPFIHTPQVGRTARWMHEHGVRAVFSGHGGDEGASHRMHPDEMWHHGELLPWLAEERHSLRGKSFPGLRAAKHLLHRIRTGYRCDRPWWARGGRNEALLAENFRRRMADTPFPPLCFGYDPAAFVRQGGQRARVDNAAVQAAEHQVRYLFPLMDHRVMAFALGIPRRMYLHRGQDRHIYRQAFASLLPQEVVSQTRKDSPGSSSFRRSDHREDYRRAADTLITLLDDGWARYWNMPLVRSIRGRAGTEDCPLDVRSINDLYICLLIQRLQKQGENHG